MRRKVSDTEHVLDVGETTFSDTPITWGYDNVSRLTCETYDYGNDDALGGSTHLTVDDYTSAYAYDATGNRTSKVTDQKNDGSADQTISYVYDDDNELNTETATSSTGALPTPNPPLLL